MKKLDNQVDMTPEIEKSKIVTTRRKFLKKAAYSAPVILVLGQLVKPTKVRADSGDPSGPPDWGGF